jgi:hypothetical protein
MMQYSKVGLYIDRQKKTKQSTKSNGKKIDWVNIALFVLLAVVVILFLVT